MVAFGSGHDLVLRAEADGVGGVPGTAGGRLLLGPGYHVPAALGGAAASAGWDRNFRASEVEVYQVRYTL